MSNTCEHCEHVRRLTCIKHAADIDKHVRDLVKKPNKIAKFELEVAHKKNTHRHRVSSFSIADEDEQDKIPSYMSLGSQAMSEIEREYSASDEVFGKIANVPVNLNLT